MPLPWSRQPDIPFNSFFDVLKNLVPNKFFTSKCHNGEFILGEIKRLQHQEVHLELREERKG
jgi:hypothetical protein